MDAQQNEPLDIKNVTPAQVPAFVSGNFIVTGFVSSFQIFSIFKGQGCKSCCNRIIALLVLCSVYSISRIRRNLSIHIARFSASESPRAYINTPKNPHFSLVAGPSLVAMRLGSDSACVSIPHGHSFFARIRDKLCSF